MTTVLVLDDDPAQLESYSRVLEPLGHQVDGTTSGETALQKLEQGAYSLVIANVYMPNKVGGIQLFKWIRSNRPGVKVILAAEPGDPQKLHALSQIGSDGVLLKPVDEADLVSTIQKVLGNPHDERVAFDEANFARMPIDDFLSGKTVAYSIYIKISEKEFIKVARSGEDLDKSRLEAFKAKGVKELWLSKDDFSRYLQINKAVVQAAAKKTGGGNESKRAKLITHACQVAYEQLRVVGLQDTTFALAQEILNTSIAAIDSNSMAASFLETIQGGLPASYAHAASGALLCALMTKVMGWSSQKNIVCLTMGAYFHDIGIQELPAELREMTLEKMAPDQKSIYRQHPTLGAKKLSTIPNIPEEVIKITAQHHENVNGQGFPSGLLRSDIFPMARMVSFVDEFLDFILASGTTSRNGPAILKLLLGERPNIFDPSSVLALEMVLKYPQIEEAKAEYRREISRVVR